ncbi:hypothetical protein N7447_005031 [Penicillium robsamsonii]|uniref:uncharacterized protein n=1 Tax=Penicillium robsamsonii TaxID=1792511 RepID=UPI00254901E5|nr:uncharacterized protein N7447_005031 [Penicillium robsamsonii]KAJ5822691.1 hypothetical protein N7447_005031 [Penicillium robsamsonii]
MYPDGLNIHDVPITNRETLESAFSLLGKGRVSNLGQFSTDHLARMIGIISPELNQDSTIPGEPGKSTRLRCRGCQRPVLNDAFLFFVVELPSCYIIEVVPGVQKGGNGCGQDGYKGKPGLVPVNHTVQDHTQKVGLLSRLNAARQIGRAPYAAQAMAWRVVLILFVYAAGVMVKVTNQKVECGRERDYYTPE